MKENSIKKEQSSIEEDIERLKLCSTNQCHICGRYEKEECMLERNRCEQHILSDYKRVLEMNKILLKENEQLKNDIKNMYDEEVIISIIEDNFNLCRNEVLELLESEEK